jgi:hypothetical protein
VISIRLENSRCQIKCCESLIRDDANDPRVWSSHLRKCLASPLDILPSWNLQPEFSKLAGVFMVISQFRSRPPSRRGGDSRGFRSIAMQMNALWAGAGSPETSPNLRAKEEVQVLADLIDEQMQRELSRRLAIQFPDGCVPRDCNRFLDR